MQLDNKYVIIISILILAILIYYFGIPFFRHLILHQDTKKLYQSMKDSNLAWQVFAKSEQDNDIYLIEQGKGESTTLVLAAMHGDEQNAFHIAVKLADTLHAYPKLINSRVVIVPVVNPDGLMDRQRTNANKVDINRNFPTENWRPVYDKDKYNPGFDAGSEKETRTVIGLINQYNPDKIIAIHADLHLINYDGPAEQLAEGMAKYNGYKVEKSIGYPTPGSLGNFAGVELKIPTITLELPDNRPEDAWEQNFEALIQAINYTSN